MARKADSRGPGAHVLFAIGLAGLLAPLNSTMVAVALPEIRDEFDVGIVAVTWLVTGYLVAVAVSQPIGGRLGDAFGSIVLLKSGLALMALFSLLSAISPSFELLLLTRSLQGVAAALLIPNATAYVRRAAAADHLGRSLGFVGGFIAVGAAAGPVVGGLLLAAGDWRLLFLANLPVVAIALVLIFALPSDAPAERRPLRLQPASIAALIAAFAGMALLGTALRSGSAALFTVAVAVGIGGVAAYWMLYRRQRGGVVDLQLFNSRAFAGSAAMTALTNLVMYTTLIVMPVYLRDHRDFGSAAIGAVLFAMSAAMAMLSWSGGRLVDAIGTRLMLAGGAAVILGASVLVGASVQVESMLLLVAALALLGVGMGFSSPAQQTSGMSAWPAEVAGSAAGTLSLMRYVGSVAGASILAAVLGASPELADIELLLGIVALVAVLNVVVALTVNRGPAESQAPASALSAPPRTS